MREKTDINYYWKFEKSYRPNKYWIRIYWLDEIKTVVIASNIIVSHCKTVAKADKLKIANSSTQSAIQS